MGDLLAIARSVLDRTAGLPGEFEVFAQEARTTTIKAYARQVESVVAGEPRGVGLQYVHAARRGYAYTADFGAEGMRRLVDAAVANATASDPDEAAGLPPGPPVAYPVVPGLWRPELGATSMERKVSLALRAEEVALSHPDIETVEESVYSDTESRVAIVSSLGIAAEGEATFCYVYLSAHARRGDDVQTAMGLVSGREPNELDAEAAGLEAAGKAAALLGAAPCPSGRYTVVFDPEVAAAVLSVISQALSAEAVQKGRSLFAGRVGEQVAAAQVRLVDDGLHPDGMASAAFDDEGVPSEVTPLIEGGVLRGFLHNSYTARKEGGATRSTGNASRGSYRGAPGVAPTNLVLDPGSGTLDDLLGRVGRGVYVVNISGLHSGANPVNGQFSVGATGHLIDSGGRGRPVREITIASDMLALLANVVDRAGDARWIPMYGSVLAPSIAIADVTVSGT